MSNVLSQSEIDELLSALTSGSDGGLSSSTEEPVARVKDYNFKTANKFPKEHIRTLQIVFDDFAQMLANQLTGVLRIFCEAEVVSVEEQTFSEFSNSLPSPIILAIMALAPLQGSILMELTPTIAYAMINRVFGGADEVADVTKTFTEIEMASVRRVIRQWVPLMRDAWERVVPVEPVLERMETSAQFAQIASLNETTAIITIKLKIGQESDFINICIPRIAIEPVSNQLTTKLWFSGTASRTVEPQEETLRQHLVSVPIDVTAIFQGTQATLGEIMHLKPGDVIQLNHMLEQPLSVHVGHIPKFRCMIGTYKSRYALKVSEIIREEKEHE